MEFETINKETPEMKQLISPRTLQDYRDKGIFPYTQIAGKILYRMSDLQRILKENYINRNLHQ